MGCALFMPLTRLFMGLRPVYAAARLFMGLRPVYAAARLFMRLRPVYAAARLFMGLRPVYNGVYAAGAAFIGQTYSGINPINLASAI
jgi:hypothetical protein